MVDFPHAPGAWVVLLSSRDFRVSQRAAYYFGCESTPPVLITPFTSSLLE